MVTINGKGKAKRAWLLQEGSVLPLPFLSIVTTREAFDAVVKELEAPESAFDPPNEWDAARIWPLKRGATAGVYVIFLNHEWLKNNDWCKHSHIVGMMVHEATHLTDWVLEDIGEDKPGMESRAYLVQHFTSAIVTAYEKLVPKKEQYGGLFQ